MKCIHQSGDQLPKDTGTFIYYNRARPRKTRKNMLQASETYATYVFSNI